MSETNGVDIDRDALEAVDPDLVPMWRVFPIAAYAEILRKGQAAATKKRYTDHADAIREMQGVMQMLRYYREWHPELAPTDFSARCWESREDGRWRWAILPETRERRQRKAVTAPPLGHPR